MDEEERIDFEQALDEERRRGCRRGFLFGVLAALGSVAGLVLCAVIAIGVMIETGVLPDTAAVPGSEVSDETLEFLRSEGIIGADETVLFFYSAGLLDVRELGNLVTDQRVVNYWERGEEIEITEATYPEIESIEPTFGSGVLGSSSFLIELHDGSWFELVVPSESQLDREYFEVLESTWKRES